MSQPQITGWLDDPETPGLGHVVLSDGSSFAAPDPDGSLKAQVQQVAATLGGKGAASAAPAPQGAPSGTLAPPSGAAPVQSAPAGQPGAAPEMPELPAPPGPPPGAPPAPIQGGLAAGGQVSGPTQATDQNVRGAVERSAGSDLDADIANARGELEGNRKKLAELERQRLQTADQEQRNHVQLLQQQQARDAARSKMQAEAQRKITPAEVFKQDYGAFGAILAAIGAVTGGVLAVRRGQDPNKATDFFESMINRSMQKAQADKQSYLAELQGQFNDATTAANLYQARAWDLISDRSRIMEQEATIPEEKARAGQLAKMAIAKRDQKYLASETMLAQQQVQEQRVPKPTGGARVLPPSVLDADTTEDQRIINDELERAFPDMKSKDRLAMWTKTGALDAGLAKGVFAAKEALEIVNRFTENNDLAGLGPLANYIPDAVASGDALKVRQALGAAVFAHIKEQSGAAFTEQEFQRRIAILEGAKDTASVVRGLQQMIGPTEEQRKKLETDNPAIQKIRRIIGTRQEQRRQASSSGKQAQLDAQNGQAAAAPPAPHDEHDGEYQALLQQLRAPQTDEFGHRDLPKEVGNAAQRMGESKVGKIVPTGPGGF